MRMIMGKVEGNSTCVRIAIGLLTLLALSSLEACSGAPFTSDPGTSLNEAGSPSAQGGSSEAGVGGMVQVAGNRASSGGMVSGTGPTETGGTGYAGVAGVSGAGTAGTGGSRNLSMCLAGFQSNACAKVCLNAQSCDENGNCQDCIAVLNCYVTKNSIDDCKNFSNLGIELAQAAEQECCK